MYVMLYGLGTYISGSIIKFISGSIIKFKPLQIGGLICFPLVILAIYVNGSLEILILSFAILVSYIIPGHLLRAKFRKEKIATKP